MNQATYVRTGDVPISKLTTYPGNAKRGDIPAILDSLRRNAQYRAVVAREEGKKLTVLAGNNTLLALREHGPGDCGVTFKTGDDTLPCGVCRNSSAYKPVLRTEVVTCDDETATRINLADNRTSENGTYDQAALVELLSSLDGYEGTAYDDERYEELLQATGALGDASSAFLAAFIEPDPQPAAPVPAPTGAPSLTPFSDDSSAPGSPQTGPPPTLPPSGTDGPAPANPAPYSPGVHTGPDAYTGPGARAHPGEPLPLPDSPQMVPLQWVFTLEQRDIVRGAIKAEQATAGHETAAQALTAICAARLAATTTGEDR